jgi:hypothetical protein
MNETQRAAAERLADAVMHPEAAALLRELLAEPQCEPVARMLVWCGPKNCPVPPPAARTYVEFLESDALPANPKAYWMNDRPLYTHPPQQRQPLTDKEIIALPECDDYMGGCITLLDFARAVERAHGITGEPT